MKTWHPPPPFMLLHVFGQSFVLLITPTPPNSTQLYEAKRKQSQRSLSFYWMWGGGKEGLPDGGNWPYFSWWKSAICNFLRRKLELRTLLEGGIIGFSMAEFGNTPICITDVFVTETVLKRMEVIVSLNGIFEILRPRHHPMITANITILFDIETVLIPCPFYNFLPTIFK